MRRVGGLFAQVVSPSNLWGAWRDFRRGKRARPTVASFEIDVDQAIVRLADALASGAYRPGRYRLRLLLEPKKRLIAAAPVRDRIVHHAVYRVLSPVLDPSLVDSTYACLDGRGGRRAVIRFCRGLRRFSWVLLLDIRRYFPSIDRRILLGLLGRKLRERRLIDLLGTIAEAGDAIYRQAWVREALGFEDGFPPAGSGLPIGNLTSQWWANHYLSGLDHFVRRELHLPEAIRYMDDIALFADDQRRLEDARESVRAWLGRERHLELKDPSAPVQSARGAFTYLGYRITRAGAGPSATLLGKVRVRLRELAEERDIVGVERALVSYRGLVAPM
jgi:RNA-directed DNA polymerase